MPHFTPRHQTLSERFWEHVTAGRPDECWLWTGHLRYDGYGIISNGPERRAHRASWVIHFGPVPKGLFVLHKCDNRACVNPNHLFTGTNEDNIADMVSKKRHAFGSRYACAKLNEQKVWEIRVAACNPCVDWKDLAKEYGVSHTVIHATITGKLWKHVPMPDGVPIRQVRKRNKVNTTYNAIMKWKPEQRQLLVRMILQAEEA